MSRTSISVVESARLVNLIEAEFVESGKTDGEFGAYATEKLGFPVNVRLVHCRRTELGIPSRSELRKSAAPVDILNLTERLTSIERQLAADQKELRGLAELFLDLKSRTRVLENTPRLKGHFEGFTS